MSESRLKRIKHRLLWWEKDLQLGVLRIAFRGIPHRPPIRLQSGQRVLLVRNDRLGDAILSTGIIRTLQRHLPGVRIDVWARPGPAEIFATLPNVGVVPFRPGILGVPASVMAVRRRRYDVGVNLAIRAHSIHNQALLGMAGIPIRVGLWDGERPTTYTTPIRRAPADRPIIHQFARVLTAFGLDPDVLDLSPTIFLTAADRAVAAEFAQRLAQHFDRHGAPVIALNCFAGKSERCWPIDHGIALTKKILAQRPTWRIVWLTDAAHRSAVEAVTDALEVGRSGTPAVRRVWAAPIDRHARELAALATCFDLLVSPDTAWVHLAAAMGVPVVGLFPPDPGHRIRWGPLGVPHRFVDCAPTARIRDTPPTAVWAALADLAHSLALSPN